MLLGTLGASLLGTLLTGRGVIAASQGHKAKMLGRVTMKAQLELVKEQLEQIRTFNGASPFNISWDTKVLSKQT